MSPEQQRRADGATGHNLTGQVALVTGAGRGLGRAVALALAAAGADVACLARSQDEVAETATAVAARGRRALALALDVTQTADLEAAVARTEAELGPLTILVQGAGTTAEAPALEVTEADWDRVLAVNLKAPFFLAQAAARRMAGRGYGRIIQIASVLGLVGAGYVAPYAASKGGLVNLTRALALEWARYGITVNAVAPGYVETALNRAALANPQFRQRVLDRTPLRRLGTPDEVAAAVLYLAAPAAGFVTGHVLAVDGGWLAQ